MNFDVKITLLSKEQVWGVNFNRKLDVLEKYGTISAITDLAILTGGYCEDSCTYMAPDDDSLKGRVGYSYTRSSDGDGDVAVVAEYGNRGNYYRYIRKGAVRPALQSSENFDRISPNRVRGYNDTYEVEFGEYPQYAPDEKIQKELELVYKKGLLRSTGRNYTFDKTKYNDYNHGFQPITYDEFEYQGKRYIRVKVNSHYGNSGFKLSNGSTYHNGDYVWVEVSPVVWLIDDKTKTLLSKRGLLSGIRFHTDEKPYNGDFSTTEMKEYLDNYMLRDLMQNTTLTSMADMYPEENKEYEEAQIRIDKNRSPYGLSLGQISEEEIRNFLFENENEQENLIMSLVLGSRDGFCYPTEVIATALNMPVKEVRDIIKKNLLAKKRKMNHDIKGFNQSIDALIRETTRKPNIIQKILKKF